MRKIITTCLICLTLLLVNTCVDLPANPEPSSLGIKNWDMHLLELEIVYLKNRLDNVENKLSTTEVDIKLQQLIIDELKKKVNKMEKAISTLITRERLEL